MPKKVDIEAGARFNNLTIIREIERISVGKEYRRAVEVICDCGHTFAVRYSALVTGNTKSCGCIGFKYVTPENRSVALDTVLYNKSFVREDNDTILDGAQKLQFYCTICSNSFQRDFNSVISKKLDCPCCNKQYSRPFIENKHLKSIEKALEFTSLIFKSKCSDKPLRYGSNVSLWCRDCHTTIIRRLDVIVGKMLDCPCKTKHGFNTSKPAQLYLLELLDSTGIIKGYKYGISNDVNNRIPAISRHFSGYIKPWCIWEYEDGSLAQEHEKLFKKAFPSFMNRIELKDGWTETFDPVFLVTFLHLQDLQYRGS